MPDEPQQQPSVEEIVQNFLYRLQELNLPKSDDMARFTAELGTINESIKALDLSTKAAAQSQKNTAAKFYETSSASSVASRGTEVKFTQSGAGGASVTPDAPVSSQEAQAKRQLGTEYPNTPGVLGAIGNFASTRGGFNERVNAAILGTPEQRGGGGPSIADQADMTLGGSIPSRHERLKIPQIGEFTTQNFLEWLSDSAMHRAQQGAVNDDGTINPDSHMGLQRTSAALYKASEYSAKWALLKQFAGRYGYDIAPHDLTGMGGLQGLGATVGTGGGGDISASLPFIGKVGMRIPFLDPQFLKGASEEWQRSKMAMGAGINKTQANTIFDNLYQLGWLGGDRTNDMRQSGAQIMKYNTQLGNNPAVYQAMDKATRMGMQSLNEFVGVVKQIPDAAKAAHVSLDQMVQDGNALGELNQQQGGTYAAGFRSAQYISQLTGLPSGVFAQMFQNPLVQSQAMLNTGLGPWVQGLQTPEERLQSVFGAVNSMLPGTRFGNRTINDHGVAGEFGFRHFVSGSSQQDAMLSKLLGVGPEWVHKMKDKKFQQRVLVGTELLGAGEDWSAKVHRVAGRGDKWHPLFGMQANHTGSLGDLRKMMKMAVNQHGKQMFSEREIQSVMDAAKVNGHRVGATKGHWIHEPAMGRGEVPGAGHWVPGKKAHWEGTSPEQASEKAYKKMRDLYKKKNPTPSDPNAPKVTIDLSPAARKLFGLKNDTKDKANAGQGSVNLGFGTGPTNVGPFGPGSGYEYYP
jgi:hypothetical protein